MSTTIRVSEATKARLAAIARGSGRPMTDVLEDAVDALERKLFLERLNRRFEELRDDPASWAEIEGERGVEERSLPAG